MIVEQRRQKVLDLVSERGFIALADLAKELEASESTIRRDLDYWDQHGAIKRTHGGAVFVADNGSFPALDDRSAKQLEEKGWADWVCGRLDAIFKLGKGYKLQLQVTIT